MIPIGDTVRVRSTPVVTWVLVLLNFLVFFYELSLSPHGLRLFTREFGVVPIKFELWQNGSIPLVDVLFPYLSSLFVHAGWAHILGNMLFLWIFGDNVEDRQGSATFLAFYLVCGLAANVAQTIIDPASTLPEIGASGAIAGVLGAYVLYYPEAQIRTLVFLGFFITVIRIPAVIYLGVWFAIQFFSGVAALDQSAQTGGVAFFAHIGGFISGLILAPFVKRW